jgi:hypothetical protein
MRQLCMSFFAPAGRKMTCKALNIIGRRVVMPNTTFDNLTVRRNTAGAMEDMLTLDSVDGSDGNGREEHTGRRRCFTG